VTLPRAVASATITFAAVGFAVLAAVDALPAAAVRDPAVAGQYYPAAADTLRKAIDAYLAEARAAVSSEPVAIVAPHAGWVFSGQIAADAFGQVKGRELDVVVVLGVNHTTPGFNRIAVHPGEAFLTPLGRALIDRGVADAILAGDHDAVPDAKPHEREHSIEVLVPFIQVLFPRARIVPIIVATPDPEACARFGRVLASALAGRRSLIVASSDLSHYPAAADAVRVDRETLEAVASLDPSALVRRAEAIAAERPQGVLTAACGLLPVLAAMTAARHLGAQAGEIVSYAHSAQVAVGDPSRVVGYGAVVFGRGPLRAAGALNGAQGGSQNVGAKDALDADARRSLLALARNTITRFLESETLPLPRDFDESVASRHQGAFVTLKEGGRLRGCIGRVVHNGPLPQLVSLVALQAAFKDPRFRPLTHDELNWVKLEISLLSPPRSVENAEDIVVGRDGVMLSKNGRTAVFLPYVAVEQGWNRERLLTELCAKAGLPRACWQEDATLAVFQTDVFSESGLE
jgi:AmmeMemoRadiSam system protein B/AmmeMemoRadiSam system protein A